MVYQDGQAFKDENGDMRAQNVMDNLIYRREIPVMIGVFINPVAAPTSRSRPRRSGATGSRTGDGIQRAGRQVRPRHHRRADAALTKDYNISKDPEMHGIGGSSSGAIAAFTVAWERPNAFRKVLSNVGSFTNIRGGHVYPDNRAGEPEEADPRLPLRRPQRQSRHAATASTTRSGTGSSRTSECRRRSRRKATTSTTPGA